MNKLLSRFTSESPIVSPAYNSRRLFMWSILIVIFVRRSMLECIIFAAFLYVFGIMVLLLYRILCNKKVTIDFDKIQNSVTFFIMPLTLISYSILYILLRCFNIHADGLNVIISAIFYCSYNQYLMG